MWNADKNRMFLYSEPEKSFSEAFTDRCCLTCLSLPPFTGMYPQWGDWCTRWLSKPPLVRFQAVIHCFILVISVTFCSLNWDDMFELLDSFIMNPNDTIGADVLPLGGYWVGHQGGYQVFSLLPGMEAPAGGYSSRLSWLKHQERENREYREKIWVGTCRKHFVH